MDIFFAHFLAPVWASTASSNSSAQTTTAIQPSPAAPVKPSNDIFQGWLIFWVVGGVAYLSKVMGGDDNTDDDDDDDDNDTQ